MLNNLIGYEPVNAADSAGDKCKLSFKKYVKANRDNPKTPKLMKDVVKFTSLLITLYEIY